jgi:hypothetical protein
VGELVVAKGVGVVARVVGLDQIFVVGEVLEHVDEVFTRLGLNLVFLEPVEELLFVVGTVVNVASKSGSSLKFKKDRLRFKKMERKKVISSEDVPW